MSADEIKSLKGRAYLEVKEANERLDLATRRMRNLAKDLQSIGQLLETNPSAFVYMDTAAYGDRYQHLYADTVLPLTSELKIAHTQLEVAKSKAAEFGL